MWAGRQITNAIVGADTISFGDAAVIVGAASVANAGGPWVNGALKIKREYFQHAVFLHPHRHSLISPGKSPPSPQKILLLFAVGYGRPDVTVEDIKTGVSAETEIAKDFELPELLAQWAVSF